ncbi:Tn3 family transposase [Nocardia farcinica]|uniref:Tn3 family transposase n=1 Tax=Nocardia farcinica TaxID=37329 RepID=UPI0018951405|nr:Tn3 family transposase [Nocardia farcinica]MBF6260607.1 Tn3 family transposase [Nocardia farcinica]MBF6279723.1 Tn3 family transposase [Nocardia farcinica]MBF6292939.1 Tn3 family transposase [Nocardia farcinica]MBF6303617.1 Tn3 family transposase [Nocardia farcinica]
MSPAAITDRTRSGTEGDLARYLRSRGLQREINDGLNVIESWNRANSIIFYGKNAELASNRRDEQKKSVLCLRI